MFVVERVGLVAAVAVVRELFGNELSRRTAFVADDGRLLVRPLPFENKSKRFKRKTIKTKQTDDHFVI